MSDFEVMMAKKKEERQAMRRRKKNVDIISDSDDLIMDMLRRMKEAAEVNGAESQSLTAVRWSKGRRAQSGLEASMFPFTVHEFPRVKSTVVRIG